MNESMLMMARSHRSELSQDAAQAQRAAQVRRTARARRTQSKTNARAATPPRAPRPGSWLATAVAHLRLTAAGR